MNNSHRSSALRAMAALALVVTLTACQSADSELDDFISETKKEPGGRVEPLPEVKPYQTFAYSATAMRSPFVPGGAANTGPNVRPDVKRNREFLEQFSLDTLRMVGTLRLAGVYYGLVQTKDGLVHRVVPGNHIGQADGRITEVSSSKISLIEIVPDGLGGYMERPAALALNE